MKKPSSFQFRYCQRWGVAPGAFRADLLARSLYPHARPLAPLLRRLDSQHFQADYEFIDDVGHLENIESFQDALDGYVGHFSNQTFLRHQLRLRVSVRRMWRIVREILTDEPTAGLARRMEGRGSVTPFERKPSAGDKSGP
jgi:hypothetical protein